MYFVRCRLCTDFCLCTNIACVATGVARVPMLFAYRRRLCTDVACVTNDVVCVPMLFVYRRRLCTDDVFVPTLFVYRRPVQDVHVVINVGSSISSVRTVVHNACVQYYSEYII